VSWEHWLICGGIWPVNEFEVKSRSWRDEMLPINGEISPSSWSSKSEIDITCFDVWLLHSIPDQLQWGFVSIQFARILFGSFVMDFLNCFNASISTSIDVVFVVVVWAFQTIMDRIEMSMTMVNLRFRDNMIVELWIGQLNLKFYDIA
jgi:hypothetical protein